jgi:MFS superfamily sulfate permease-like transporter
VTKWRPARRSWAGLVIIMVTGVLVVKLGFVIGVIVGVAAAGGLLAARAVRTPR